MMDQINIPVRKFILQADNYEKHRALLERGPYIRKLDLALSVYEVLVDNNEQLISVKVTWDMLESMDISPEHLFELAAQHCREELPAKVSRLDELLYILKNQMTHILQKDMDEIISENMPEMFSEEMPSVYVLSNERGVRGAAVLFYTDEIRELADKLASDLVLLPSSIHEWLIMPKTKECNLADIAMMVREINATVVEEKDFLSDNIYRYCREKNDIEIVTDI